MTYAFLASLTLLFSRLNYSHGFVCTNGYGQITVSRRDFQCLAVPTPEESAQALTDYMTKSHEEKLKAVKAAEDKNKAEIESLKEKIKELESIPSSSAIVNTPPPPPPPSGSVEEMSAKLIAYQKFMANYIVNAQEEKIKAIKAAEQAVTKKYEEKLNTFMLSGAAEEPTAIISTDEQSPGSKLYKDRNAKVAAAAKAGKSRWGDKEIQRVSSGSSAAAIESTLSKTTVSVAVPPEVTAADHGLRADGGVGGLTLAERVALGAESKANGVAKPEVEANGVLSPSAPIHAKTVLFNQRNAKIAAATKAGKQSRWGGKEEERAVDLAQSAPAIGASPVPPEVVAADHGLGASGPSLADRVNLGARLLDGN